MTKRILLLIPSLDRAGAEKQMSLLARGLPPHEFDVHVCALTRGGPLAGGLQESGIPVTVIGKRWRLDPHAFWRLKSHVARLQPDLIHAGLLAANAYGLAAAKVCGVKRFVAAQRCVDPWKGYPELAVDRCVARHASAVVANSPGVRDFYVRNGLPAEKIRVIANGVCPAAQSRITRRGLLAELGLAENIRLIGLVGRLWAQKRVKDAIWAADLLGVIHKDIRLLVIGDGPQRERIRKFCNQVVAYDSVSLLGERSDVARIMPHFDVFWSTSAYEGQSNSVMEAMAAGVPVVATDIAGTRDLVVPHKTGYLVPVGDRAAFTRYTNKLLDNPDLAQQLGEAGRRRMLDEFAVEKMIERYAGLYGELLG